MEYLQTGSATWYWTRGEKWMQTEKQLTLFLSPSCCSSSLLCFWIWSRSSPVIRTFSPSSHTSGRWSCSVRVSISTSRYKIWAAHDTVNVERDLYLYREKFPIIWLRPVCHTDYFYVSRSLSISIFIIWSPPPVKVDRRPLESEFALGLSLQGSFSWLLSNHACPRPRLSNSTHSGPKLQIWTKLRVNIYWKKIYLQTKQSIFLYGPKRLLFQH